MKTAETVTNQIAFDQKDLHSTPESEHAMDCRCQALVFIVKELFCFISIMLLCKNDMRLSKTMNTCFTDCSSALNPVRSPTSIMAIPDALACLCL